MQTLRRFEKIALPHLESVYRAAVAICGCADEAEDLTQTTFAKALERFHTLEPGTNCRAWLFRILRNHWIDRLRHKKAAGHDTPVHENLVDRRPQRRKTAWSDAEDLLENFSDEQIIVALRRLPEDRRLTLFLVDVERLDQQQVAQITGVAIGTVKSRANRARNELKGYLRSYAREMGFTGRD